MKQYLLNVYQPDGEPPVPEVLDRIMERTRAWDCGTRRSRIAVKIDVDDVVFSRDHITRCPVHVRFSPCLFSISLGLLFQTFPH